ncbi:hypothetical protein FRC08_006561 [Ceratobasidium sp. 394]|nr:hypothetical protein FRC08_006561 [Ceratobasidium sp. 394]
MLAPTPSIPLISSVDRYNVATATCIDTAARAISLLGSICVFVLAGTAFASFDSAHLPSNSQNACPWRASQASECRDDGVVVLVCATPFRVRTSRSCSGRPLAIALFDGTRCSEELARERRG